MRVFTNCSSLKPHPVLKCVGNIAVPLIIHLLTGPLVITSLYSVENELPATVAIQTSCQCNKCLRQLADDLIQSSCTLTQVGKGAVRSLPQTLPIGIV